MRRRCPILCRALGVTLEGLIIDMLHCLHLGVLQKYVMFCWWSLSENNARGVMASNEEELFSLSVHRLRSDLFHWYPVHRARRPDEVNAMTQLTYLTPKTLGPKGSNLLKAKAAMTRPLVPFTTHLLTTMPNKAPHQVALLTGGEALDKILVLLKEAPRNPPPQVVQDPWESWI